MVAGIMDIYDIPARLSLRDYRPCFKQAVVVAEKSRNIMFYETVMCNSFFRTSVFTGFEAAADWLGKDLPGGLQLSKGGFVSVF